MATTYPTSADSFTRPGATDPMNSPSHSGVEDNQYDALEAIEDTVGITGAFNFSRGATYTVASNTSTAANKKNADYICDGTADEVQINAAITAANAVGGTVLLFEGTFSAAASITLLSNVALVGMGPNATIIQQAASINGDLMAGNNKSYFSVRHLQLDGNKANNPTGDNGLSLNTNCRLFVIEDVRSINNVLKGFSFEACKDGRIVNNEASANNQDGFSVSTSTTDHSRNLRFIGNNGHDNTQYGLGISVATTAHQVPARIFLINNDFNDNSTYGINIKGLDGGAIIGNELAGNDLEGILLGSADDVLYRADDIIVSNNVVKNSGTVASNRNGIRLQSTADCVVTNNRCYDDQGTKTQDYGIYINDGTRAIVTGNNVRGNKASFIGGDWSTQSQIVEHNIEGTSTSTTTSTSTSTSTSTTAT